MQAEYVHQCFVRPSQCHFSRPQWIRSGQWGLAVCTGSIVSSLEFYLEFLIVRCAQDSGTALLNSDMRLYTSQSGYLFWSNPQRFSPFLTCNGYIYAQPILKRPCTCLHKSQIRSRSPKLNNINKYL